MNDEFHYGPREIWNDKEDRTIFLIFAGIFLVFTVAVVGICVWGLNRQDNCRDRGGVPYRGVCLDPGSLR